MKKLKKKFQTSKQELKIILGIGFVYNIIASRRDNINLHKL